ncbi:cobalamin biosynthesis protein [Klebsiella pneumoniae]
MAGGYRPDMGRGLGATALAHGIHPWLGWLVEVWMIFTALAGRCLAQSAMAVARPLQAGDLAEAGIAFLDPSGAIPLSSSQRRWHRAAVETVAENTVDGIIAPLFFLLLGGAPLAMAYRKRSTPSIPWSAINTQQGRFARSAPVYDVANFLPARLSWLLLRRGAMPGRWRPGAAYGLARSLSAQPHPRWPESLLPARWGSALAARTITSASALKSPG